MLRPAPAARSPRALAWLGLLSGVLLVSVLVSPVREAPMSFCLVHLLLGVAGPGCGMVRAFLFIGHGDVTAALAMNPNSGLAFAIVVLLWANAALRVAARREVAVALPPRGRWMVWTAAAALTGAAWVYNLVWNPWA